MRRARSASFCALLAMVMALVSSVAVVYAEQSDPELSGLFAELKQAADAAQAAEIESRIWRHWLQAPDDEALRLLTQCSHSIEQLDYREALIAATHLTEQYPDYAEGWNKRATVLYQMGDYDGSVHDIEQTLQREPRHFGAISGLGLIFLARSDLKGALAAFEQVQLISPQSINARRNIAWIRQALENEL